MGMRCPLMSPQAIPINLLWNRSIPEWYFVIAGLLREIRKKAWDARHALEEDDAGAAKAIYAYLKTDFQQLRTAWEANGFDLRELGNLGRHVSFGMEQDFIDMLKFDIAGIEQHLDGHLRTHTPKAPKVGFENFLHPVVKKASLRHYTEGVDRNAVLDAMLALSDLLRERSGLSLDGKPLVTQALSLQSPRLILSEISSESGQNDQKGFMEMISGAYIGIRNPKAQSLVHDPDGKKAAQYLITISLLVRRIAEAAEAAKED